MSDIGIMTIKGLEGLKKMKKKPDNWRIMVCHYLQHKEDWIKRQRANGKKTFEMELQYAKAIKLADDLGIVWPVKI